MKKVFISYLHEDRNVVLKLQEDLENRGIQTWIDESEILPGQNWKSVIREAINNGDAFIACYSSALRSKQRSFFNSEVRLAIEILATYPSDRAWFIPVKLDDCVVPNPDLGGGQSLNDIQWVNLFHDWEKGVERIAASLKPYFDEFVKKAEIDDRQLLAWEAILSSFQSLSTNVEALWVDLCDDNIREFKHAYFTCQEIFTRQTAMLEPEEYEQLTEILRAIGSYRIGKMRLYEMRRRRSDYAFGFRKFRDQIQRNGEHRERFKLYMVKLEEEIKKLRKKYPSVA